MLLRRALERGRVRRRPTVGDDVLEFLAARAGGDARAALTGARAGLRDGRRRAGHDRARRGRAPAQGAALRPRRATSTTTTISAWIKATRGSDPDASLYYLAVMLEGGEDPRFIARRMVDPRLRGRRQRRPAGAGGRGRGGARRRARGHARGPVRAGPGGDLPGPGAEVQRRQAGDRRRPGARARARRPSCRPTTCARAPTPARPSSAAARAMTTPTPARARLRRRSCCRPSVEGSRFYEPGDGRGGAARAAGGDPPRPRARRCDVGHTRRVFTGDSGSVANLVGDALSRDPGALLSRSYELARRPARAASPRAAHRPARNRRAARPARRCGHRPASSSGWCASTPAGEW